MIVIKKRRPKSKNYFTQETEDAIVLYNNTPDSKLRSKIYESKIHYAFFKLTENIIHTFKFYYTEVDDIEHLQHEIITFLLSKIHLFDPSRGAKAYSYFGTIVKRWLIIYNTKNYKTQIGKTSIDDLHKNGNYYEDFESETKADELSFFIDEFTNHVSNNFQHYFPKTLDTKVADSILELFRNREKIDIFNKKALYIYIREMVDVKTPKITKIANKLYNIFKGNYIFYLENGYTNFKRI